jgi:hypothetical protein
MRDLAWLSVPLGLLGMATVWISARPSSPQGHMTPA